MADVYNQNNSEFDEFMKTPHIFFVRWISVCEWCLSTQLYPYYVPIISM